ncbi:MAG: hypothetical protein AAB295_04170, partial [Chloroflexota bacterium]
MILLEVLIVGFAAIADTGSYGLLESVGGRVDCAAVTGNGKLTVGIDAKGAVSVCRWPGPTAPNQISYADTPPSNGGAMWGMVRGKTIEWLPRTAGDVRIAEGAGAAPVVHAVYERLGVTATAFVHAERAIAVFRLQFADPPQQAEVVWASDFSPCATNMRAVPSSELFLTSRRDLVAFAGNGAIYHARPDDAGSKAWDQADAWLDGGADPDWFEKRDGVWIGYSSSTPFSGAVCGAERGDRSAVALAESADWDRQTKAVGACASAARIPFDADGKSVTVFVVLGERRAHVDDALSAARAMGYDGLLEETQRSWREKFSAATRPVSAPAPVAALYERALRRLLLCVDEQTGAVARAPYSRPPFAVDMPRFGPWATLALDLANDTEAGGRLVEFHARCVRTSDAPGAPAGSLPAAVYSSGVEAAPRAVLDVQAAAWLLWSIWQHDARIAEQERQGYRDEMWKAVELAGDFVSSWCRAVRDAPVLSFDPARLSDSASLETVAVACAGIRAAGSFANAIGHDKPEWAARALELEDFLRFHALDAAGNFEIAAPLVLWPTELVAAGDPRWVAPVQAAMDRIQAGPGPESLKALADA